MSMNVERHCRATSEGFHFSLFVQLHEDDRSAFHLRFSFHFVLRRYAATFRSVLPEFSYARFYTEYDTKCSYSKNVFKQKGRDGQMSRHL